jgi:HPt (histidine-containing phosphotransfer) domain-containing protein
MQKNDELVKKLRLAYKGRLPEKIKAVESQWEALRTVWNNEKLKAFHKLIHKFYGTSGSYGYPEVSELLEMLDAQLRELYFEKPSTEQENNIEKNIQEIRHMVAKIIRSGPDD